MGCGGESFVRCPSNQFHKHLAIRDLEMEKVFSRAQQLLYAACGWDYQSSCFSKLCACLCSKEGSSHSELEMFGIKQCEPAKGQLTLLFLVQVPPVEEILFSVFYTLTTTIWEMAKKRLRSGGLHLIQHSHQWNAHACISGV